MLSVVISAYNGERALGEPHGETTHMLEHISWDYKPPFVSDGSRDGSQDILGRTAVSDSGVRVISFSRGFGHETAMIVELDYSRGDGIICMDAGLQHPPECIPDILAKLKEGYQVIDIVRTRNRTAGLVKNITSPGFYWLINRVSDVHFEANTSDPSAISRHMAQVLKNSYGEKVRFLRDYIQNVGFKKAVTEYEARARVAGENGYNIKKLFVFSINAVLCFPNIPLKFGIHASIFSALLGLAVVIYTLCTRKGTPSSYATIVVLICSMFAMMFVAIGITGKYIVILFAELKDRPVYIANRTENVVQGENVD